MVEKRNITKEDIFLEARVLSEGVGIEVKVPPKVPLAFPTTIVFDGCQITAAIRPNRRSRLKAVIEDQRITLSDTGKVLGTATFAERPDWFDIPMSNGMPARTAVMGTLPDLIPILQNDRCYNQDSGRGCRYCGLFKPEISAADWDRASKTDIQQTGQLAAEAIKIAVDHGWRGMIALSGGALPPKRRGELTERLEILMAPLREAIDDDLLSTLQISANTYPPDNLSDLYKWRDFGLNTTQFDLEVMDPAYFPAICPGKNAAHPYEYWKEAQSASVEVFGRWYGTATSVVMGIEPMASLVEGVEERLSAGVLTTPLSFGPSPGPPTNSSALPLQSGSWKPTRKWPRSIFALKTNWMLPCLPMIVPAIREPVVPTTFWC